MTIKEIIEKVDKAKPNAVSKEQKMSWISELDGKIALRLMRQSPADVRTKYKYSHPEDLEREPLVKFPDDELYELYLYAKIDLLTQEYGQYDADMIAYNEAYTQFSTWFLNEYDPIQGECP